jgi:hypothetical protein
MEKYTQDIPSTEAYCPIKHDGFTEKQFNKLTKMKEEIVSEDYVISSAVLNFLKQKD